MVASKSIGASAGDVVVLVGTTKGLFTLAAGPDRESWDLGGPWFAGEIPRDLQVEQGAHAPVPAPRPLLGVGEPPDSGHLRRLPTST